MTHALTTLIDNLLRQRKESTCLRISIAGGSGSGKSTVSELLRKQLSTCNVTLIALDQFFKPIEELPTYYSRYHQAEQPDFNRPDSLKGDEMITTCREVSEAGVIIYEGHLGLCYPEMRALMDIRCFVECDMAEMLARRTARNLAAGYGGDRENILAYNQECVVPRYEEFILPSRNYADIVIPTHGLKLDERDALINMLCEQISQQNELSLLSET